MDRLIAILLLVLIVCVAGVGGVVWRADRHADAQGDRQACIAKANATATIALLAPASSVVKEGRLQAMTTLSTALDRCTEG